MERQRKLEISDRISKDIQGFDLKDVSKNMKFDKSQLDERLERLVALKAADEKAAMEALKEDEIAAEARLKAAEAELEKAIAEGNGPAIEAFSEESEYQKAKALEAK